jgi:hypothetical protein
VAQGGSSLKRLNSRPCWSPRAALPWVDPCPSDFWCLGSSSSAALWRRPWGLCWVGAALCAWAVLAALTHALQPGSLGPEPESDAEQGPSIGAGNAASSPDSSMLGRDGSSGGNCHQSRQRHRRHTRWRGGPSRGQRIGEAANPGPGAPGTPLGGERPRQRSLSPRSPRPAQVSAMDVDGRGPHSGSRVFCPVPGCPCSVPSHTRGWCSVTTMQSHVDGHMAGTLAGAIPAAWLQQHGRQCCAVCGLSVSSRFGVHPTCRPEARAAAAGPNNAAASGDGLPPLEALQGGNTPTLRHVPQAARHSWSKALTRALAAVAHSNADSAWRELLMLPQTVLDDHQEEARSTRRP